MLSCVQLFATQWTIQSMEFSRPEYWSGQPSTSPGDLPNPGIEPTRLLSWRQILHHCATREAHQSAVVQLLSRVRLCNPWTAARQASLAFTISQGLLKLMSIESVMPAISSSVVPFSSCLQSFPAIGSFSMSQLFASGGQRTGTSASASVLPMNIQDLFL